MSAIIQISFKTFEFSEYFDTFKDIFNINEMYRDTWIY